MTHINKNIGLALFAICTSVLMVLGIGYTQTALADTGSEVWLAFVLLIVCTVPMIHGVVSRAFDVFAPIYTFSAIFIISYFLSAMTMLFRKDVARGTYDLSVYLNNGLYLGLIGLISVQVGYFFGSLRLAKSYTNQVNVNSALQINRNRERIFQLAIQGSVIANGLVALWFISAGISLFNWEYSQTPEGGSYYLLFFGMSRYSLFILAWHYAPNRNWKQRLILYALFIVIVDVASGSRGSLAFFFVAVTVAIFLQKRSRPSLLYAIWFIVIAIFLTGFIVQWRAYNDRYELDRVVDIDLQQIFEENINEISDRGTLVGTMIVYKTFQEDANFLGPELFREILVTMVPRALWPEKPTETRVVGQVIRTEFGGTPPARDWIATYYAGFGIPGIVGYLFIMGYVSAIIYNSWQISPTDGLRQTILALWLPFMFMGFHRGGTVWFVTRLIYNFGPVFIIWFVDVNTQARTRIIH